MQNEIAQDKVENISFKMLKMQQASVICHNQLLANGENYKRKLRETISRQQCMFGLETSEEKIAEEIEENTSMRLRKQLLKSQQAGIIAIARQASAYLDNWNSQTKE